MSGHHSARLLILKMGASLTNCRHGLNTKKVSLLSAVRPAGFRKPCMHAPHQGQYAAARANGNGTAGEGAGWSRMMEKDDGEG